MPSIFSKQKILIYTTAFLLTNSANGLNNSHNLISSNSKLSAKENTSDSSNNNSIEKINAQLFIVNNNVIIPYLISNHLISKNQLVYKFKLKKNLSHDNDKLISKNIKSSVETFIKNNFEDFHSISGAEEFFEGKSKNIKGIILDTKDNLSFTIVLNKKDPKFLEKLTAIQIPIHKPNKEFYANLEKPKDIVQSEIYQSQF
jgi:ABC-type oligopeptide transport system substrate-binding subunit